MSLAGTSGGNKDNKKNDTDNVLEEPTILSVADAIRLLPTHDAGEVKPLLTMVRGMIISQRPVIKMISGRYDKCPQCDKQRYTRLEKPVFNTGDARYANGEPLGFVCREESELHDIRTDTEGNTLVDKETGRILRKSPFLKIWWEYRNATIIELQDMEKFDDLERLQIILFDDDTRDIRAGEQLLIKGTIYFEHFSKKDSSLHSRLYSHSITYEARKEITLSSQDVDAVKRFVSKFGDDTVDQLSHMLAQRVIGLYHIKKALILCANSACDDTKESSRRRLNALLVGEPGLAKTMLLREICAIVPNGRVESAQNSTGRSLTAIVSKEGGGDDTVLRLGAIPFAKESVCGLNEVGRMRFEDQAPLLDVMEEGGFTINKYGLNARIRSPTVIIGSANPTGSKWSTTNDGLINLNDIPAIKPLIDRFDYVLIVKMSRDKQASKQYADDKSKYENTPAPNYNSYLEKHLIYCKRFRPKVSDRAIQVLNEFYSGVVSTKGSPRVYDTLYRTAKQIASLKLKRVVDAIDAKQACEFYNEIQMEYNRIVFIPPDPLDTACSESIYTLETEGTPMIMQDIIDKTCLRVEDMQTFVGNNHTYYGNRKVQSIHKRMVEDTRIEQISDKPITLRYIKKTEKPEHSDTKSDNTPPHLTTDTTDTTDISDKSLSGITTSKTSILESDKGHSGLSDMSDMSDMSDSNKSVMEEPSSTNGVCDLSNREKADVWIAEYNRLRQEGDEAEEET